MAYTSTTLTLAMAESLAHVNVDDLDPDTPPALVYVRVTIPDADALSIDQISARLPNGWDDIPAPAVDSELGDAWIRSGRCLALLVPSVHVPIETPERNVLVNPLHAPFAAVDWTVNDFSFDRRLLRARAGGRPRRKGTRR